jgi:hypothetical protein
MSRDFLIDTEKTVKPVEHYYGDIVRGCFAFASFILLGTMLIDWRLLNLYLIVGVAGTAALVVLAGLTNPKSLHVLMVEAAVSALSFIFFEYAAIGAFQTVQVFSSPTFLLRQLLAILFLIALYYSIKSIRWLRLLQN